MHSHYVTALDVHVTSNYGGRRRSRSRARKAALRRVYYTGVHSQVHAAGVTAVIRAEEITSALDVRVIIVICDISRRGGRSLDDPGLSRTGGTPRPNHSGRDTLEFQTSRYILPGRSNPKLVPCSLRDGVGLQRRVLCAPGICEFPRR